MNAEDRGDPERIIAAALAEHPAVREAAVLARDGALVAYVVPEPQRQPAAGQPAGQVAHWQSLWGQTYAQRPGEQNAADPTLNLSGWNSSYTGKPIRQDEMKDWVERTVERILARGPRRVLEIGCGMGLLLFRIAPRVEAYWGVDFSPEALAYVREHAARRGLANVELLQQPADAFDSLREAGSFDTVVLNSVVQYFPGPDYLLRVLDGALSVLAPGGRLFLGDLRSLPLLEAFHASVQMLQAEGGTPVAELREQVNRLVREERELVLDPAFFTALRRRLPRITRVEIQLKRGRYRNELTRFRYDAVLHLDGSGAAPEPERWLDWRQEGLSIAEVKRRLAADEPAVLGLRDVPNARVQAEVRAVELLHGGDDVSTVDAPGVATVNDLRAAVRGARGGVEPEDFWALGRSFPYDVEVGWAGSEADGSYQVVLRHRQKAAGAGDPAAAPAAGEGTDWSAYVNRPAREGSEGQLAAELRRFLAARFAEDGLPARFEIVARLPG
jgi:SAM-dependent methyltransferase